MNNMKQIYITWKEIAKCLHELKTLGYICIFQSALLNFSQVPLEEEEKSKQSRKVIPLKNKQEPHFSHGSGLKLKPRIVGPKGVQYSYL